MNGSHVISASTSPSPTAPTSATQNRRSLLFRGNSFRSSSSSRNLKKNANNNNSSNTTNNVSNNNNSDTTITARPPDTIIENDASNSANTDNPTVAGDNVTKWGTTYEQNLPSCSASNSVSSSSNHESTDSFSVLGLPKRLMMKYGSSANASCSTPCTVTTNRRSFFQRSFSNSSSLVESTNSDRVAMMTNSMSNEGRPILILDETTTGPPNAVSRRSLFRRDKGRRVLHTAKEQEEEARVTINETSGAPPNTASRRSLFMRQNARRSLTREKEEEEEEGTTGVSLNDTAAAPPRLSLFRRGRFLPTAMEEEEEQEEDEEQEEETVENSMLAVFTAEYNSTATPANTSPAVGESDCTLQTITAASLSSEAGVTGSLQQRPAFSRGTLGPQTDVKPPRPARRRSSIQESDDNSTDSCPTPHTNPGDSRHGSRRPPADLSVALQHQDSLWLVQKKANATAENPPMGKGRGGGSTRRNGSCLTDPSQKLEDTSEDEVLPAQRKTRLFSFRRGGANNVTIPQRSNSSTTCTTSDTSTDTTATEKEAQSTFSPSQQYRHASYRGDPTGVGPRNGIKEEKEPDPGESEPAQQQQQEEGFRTGGKSSRTATAMRVSEEDAPQSPPSRQGGYQIYSANQTSKHDNNKWQTGDASHASEPNAVDDGAESPALSAISLGSSNGRRSIVRFALEPTIHLVESHRFTHEVSRDNSRDYETSCCRSEESKQCLSSETTITRERIRDLKSVLWWNSEEMSKIRQECAGLVRGALNDSEYMEALTKLLSSHKRSITEDDIHESLQVVADRDQVRGLEMHICPWGGVLCEKHRRIVLTNVASTNEEGLNNTGEGWLLIRRESIKASRPCRQYALKIAEHDANEAIKAVFCNWTDEDSLLSSDDSISDGCFTDGTLSDVDDTDNSDFRLELEDD